MRKSGIIFFAVYMVLAVPFCFAEEEKLDFSLETTVFTAAGKTDLTSGGLGTEGQTEMRDNKQIGTINQLTVRKNRFLIITEVVSANLKDNLETKPAPGAPRNTEESLTWAGLFFGYRVLDTPIIGLASGRIKGDLLFGGRYNWNRFVIDEVSGGETRDSQAGWADMAVGGNLVIDFNEKWSLYGHGDGGGFGLSKSSQQSFRIASGVEHHFNDKFSLRAGYQMINLEKRTSDRFGHVTIDVFFYGPTVAGIFNF